MNAFYVKIIYVDSVTGYEVQFFYHTDMRYTKPFREFGSYLMMHEIKEWLDNNVVR